MWMNKWMNEWAIANAADLVGEPPYLFSFFFSETPTGNGGVFLERPEFSGKQKFRPGRSSNHNLEFWGLTGTISKGNIEIQKKI